MEGWVKLHRCLMEKAIWLQSTPEQKVILITLLTMANHKEKQWLWQGEKFEAIPGQFVTSIDSLVKKCGIGISKQNVRTAIEKFEKLEFLTNQSTKTGRLITLVNWQIYQSENESSNIDANKDLTKSQQSSNIELTPNKNDKKERMKECKNNYSDEFEIFWSFYPKKKSKPDALKAWKKIKLTDELLTNIMDGLKRSIKCVDWVKNGGQFIPYPATWLNGERWTDQVEEAQTGLFNNKQNNSINNFNDLPDM